MCRVCAFASLTSRCTAAALRSSGAPALGQAAHGGAVGEALQRWCHTAALPARRAAFLDAAQGTRHLLPSASLARVRGFACRTKFDAPPPKMVRLGRQTTSSALWCHACARRCLTPWGCVCPPGAGGVRPQRGGQLHSPGGRRRGALPAHSVPPGVPFLLSSLCCAQTHTACV